MSIGAGPLPHRHYALANRETGEGSIVELIPALRAFARTFYRDPDNADDLVQETLTKGLANIDKFEPGTRMKSWLFTIMRNAYYTRIKVALREAPGLIDCASSRPISEASQEWSVQSKEVHEAIQKLPAQQREVLMLIGVLGVSYEEAAEICGCAMGTVKSRLNRARVNLLDLLGETSALTIIERRNQLSDGQLDAGVGAVCSYLGSGVNGSDFAQVGHTTGRLHF
jgi:RNA polymerase sigma factor (sigma-70 family)